MSFGKAVRTCLAKSFTFSGRATRAEYWWFFLAYVLASTAAGVVEGVARGGADDLILPGLVNIAAALPLLAAGWRRMHDTGRSGLYSVYPTIAVVGIGMFAGLVEPLLTGGGETVTMVIGGIMLVAFLVLIVSPLLVLWWLTRPSQRGANEYGPDPYPRGPWEVRR